MSCLKCSNEPRCRSHPDVFMKSHFQHHYMTPKRIHILNVQTSLAFVPIGMSKWFTNDIGSRLVGENGIVRVEWKLASIIFRPLANEGLHLKNYLLWNLLMRIANIQYLPKVWERASARDRILLENAFFLGDPKNPIFVRSRWNFFWP